jgi:hypothetical protein
VPKAVRWTHVISVLQQREKISLKSLSNKVEIINNPNYSIVKIAITKEKGELLKRNSPKRYNYIYLIK